MERKIIVLKLTVIHRLAMQTATLESRKYATDAREENAHCLQNDVLKVAWLTRALSSHTRKHTR